MNATAAKPDISLFFPVYNDEHTVRRVTEKALKFLADVAGNYEILIIDDGSPDRSGIIADALAQEFEHVRVIHHPKNLGYGAALRTGLNESRYPWICFTDGDDEYDVFDFHKLLRLKDYYDLIITFRYIKLYSSYRQFMSFIYNFVFRALFRTRYRDISTGLRMIRRSVAQDIALTSDSPFIGAELTVKAMLKGFRVGEVGIQTFPRSFGKGASVTRRNVLATIRDMLRVRRSIFAAGYDLPRPQGYPAEESFMQMPPPAAPQQDAEPVSQEQQEEYCHHTHAEGDAKRNMAWREICRYLQKRYIPPQARILDLGAGQCHFINNIRGREKHALDIFPGLAHYTKDAVAHVGSCTTLERFDNQAFDTVFSSNLFEHLTRDELNIVLKDIRRILSPGGKLIVMQPNFATSYKHYFDDFTHIQIFTHIGLSELLRSHGFSLVAVKGRFLPFSLRSRLPVIPLLVRAYLHSPIKPMAGQMLMVAEN